MTVDNETDQQREQRGLNDVGEAIVEIDLSVAISPLHRGATDVFGLMARTRSE